MMLVELGFGGGQIQPPSSVGVWCKSPNMTVMYIKTFFSNNLVHADAPSPQFVL